MGEPLAQSVHPMDPLYESQWHLYKGDLAAVDINVSEVWLDYTGRGVVVGVIEDAVQWDHPDLIDNYDSSLDFDAARNDAGVSSGGASSHATAVAGLIGASANDEGVVGVAYDATLVSYEVEFTSSFYDAFERAMGVATDGNAAHGIDRGADIINNSWAFTSPFVGNFNSIFSELQSMGRAIEDAAEFGRDDLGTVMLWAAGNDRNSAGGQWANGSNLTNSPHTIAVGAIDVDGDYASYSNPGANLLISAPSSGGSLSLATTTTGSGYTFSFGGTSGATPVVSGVTALMLEANPELGYRDVQDILAHSARHVDLRDLSQADDEPAWTVNAAESWNGGGLLHSNDFGFGLVDAHAAVRLAESWNKVQSYGDQERLGGSHQQAAVSFDAGSPAVTAEIDIAGSYSVEHAEVTLDLSHTEARELVVALVSPSGTRSLLMEGNGGSSSYPGSSFTLSSAAFRGEDSAGTWQIEISDTVAGTSGSFSGWSLTLYSKDTADDLADIFVFTDEYSDYALAEPGRLTLSDDDGGIDTLNAAPVTSDSYISLGGGSSLIDGVSLTIDQSIENAVGGDGNDSLLGNDGDNVLTGGRGADVLFGFGGEDKLDGGAGNDEIYDGQDDDDIVGGSGDDTLYVGEGFDVVDGGDGIDTVKFAAVDDKGVALDLSFGLGFSGAAKGDRFARIENVEGTAYADDIQGDSSANRIDGFADSDVLDGGWGNDTLLGGLGSDTLEGGQGEDSLDGGEGNDQLDGESGADDLSGGEGDDLVSGGEDSDTLSGGTGNDTLDGGEGGDLLSGGEDADTLIGGSGNDTLDGGEGDDQLDGESGADDLSGGEGGDVISGGEDDDTLAGGADADLLRGGSGDDSLDGGMGADTLIGGEDEDLLAGDDDDEDGEGDDRPDGGGDDDTLAGGADADLLQGGSGDDSLDGGTGSDTLIGGEDEDLLAGDEGDDRLYGGEDDDTLAGGAGDDTLDGGAAADVLDGGEGFDTASYESASFGVSVRLDDPDRNFGEAAGDSYHSIEAVIGSHFSDYLRVSSQGGDRLEGLAGHDIFVAFKGANGLFGGEGDDRFFSGLSSDTIDGGAGIDTVYYDAASQGMLVDLLSGVGRFDRAEGDSYAGIENVIGGKSDDTLIGDGSDNLLYALGGNDSLDGQDGDDRLFGREGDDSVAGGAGDDDLYGGEGDDTVLGGAGADRLYGGEGFDTASYETAASGVSVRLDDLSKNSGEAVGDSYSSIEAIIGSNFDDYLRGSSKGGEQLEGLDGDDILLGFGGSNSLLGGAGDDRFFSGFSDDLIDGGSGVDTVYYDAASQGIFVDLMLGEGRFERAEGDTYIGIENVSGSFFGDTLIGDAADNQLYALSGDDLLDGLVGDDRLFGLEGDDSILGGLGDDRIDGGEGDDSLSGGEGQDTLVGGHGADIFAFEQGGGGDIVHDFDPLTDLLDFRSWGLTGFSDLSLTDGAGGVEIAFNETDSLTLENVAADSLTDAWVLWA